MQAAQKRFDTDTDVAAVPPLVAGLRATRVTRARLRALPIDDNARYEIDFRLRQKEREFQQAIVIANGIKLDALADDGVVVPGQPVKLSLILANHGADVTVKQVKFGGFDGDGACALHASRGAFFLGGGPGPGQGPAETGPAVSTVTRGHGRALRSDDDRARQRAHHRAVLASTGAGGTLHVRRRRAVRPAVPADAVLRAGHPRAPAARK